jgi:hypothetical protein
MNMTNYCVFKKDWQFYKAAFLGRGKKYSNCLHETYLHRLTTHEWI